MPIQQIISQPISGSLNAAYRPIILRVQAVSSTGLPAPPVVYCDVYINNVFYKSLSKTQYAALNSTNSEWQFDLQDAVQEVLTKQLGDNGGSVIITTTGLLAVVFCKFRSTGLDGDGFIQSENTAPVQATGGNPAVSGDGYPSATFIVMNATLQHEDNQDLASHLSAYKSGNWQSNAYPLSHRPPRYFIAKNASDYFPVLYNGSQTLRCLRLNYRLNGQSNYSQLTSCSACTLSISTLAVSVNGSGKFALSWTNVGGAPATVQIYYSTNGGSVWLSAGVMIDAQTLSTATSTQSLATNVDYDWKVVPLCGVNDPGTAATVHYTSNPCVNVTIGNFTLPPATIGSPYTANIPFTGTTPVTVSGITKPSWLGNPAVVPNGSGTGGTINFTGTPPNGSVGSSNIAFTLTNCASGSANFTGNFAVTSNSALTVVLTRNGDNLTATWDGGVPPYTYGFHCLVSGSACASNTFSNATGSTSDSTASTGYTAGSYFGASYSFTVVITDANGDDAVSHAVVYSPCLVPDTLITLADGSRKLIKDIAAGSRLADRNINTMMPGETVVTAWEACFVDKLVVVNRGLLESSLGHIHVLKGKDGVYLSDAESLKTGDVLLKATGEEVVIEMIEIKEGRFEVINISTTTGTFIANGMLTHNKLSC